MSQARQHKTCVSGLLGDGREGGVWVLFHTLS